MTKAKAKAAPKRPSRKKTVSKRVKKKAPAKKRAPRGKAPGSVRTQFKPGNPGGPGRPKGARSVSDSLRRILDAREAKVELTLNTGKKKTINLKSDSSLAEAVAIAQIMQALKGNTRAFNAILDRTEGRPLQTIETTFGKPIEDMTDEELDILEGLGVGDDDQS